MVGATVVGSAVVGAVAGAAVVETFAGPDEPVAAVGLIVVVAATSDAVPESTADPSLPLHPAATSRASRQETGIGERRTREVSQVVLGRSGCEYRSRPMGIGARRRVGAVLVAGLLLAACAASERDASVATTAAPITDVTTTPATSDAATTTAGTSDTTTAGTSPPTSAPFENPVVAAGPCAFTAPGTAITYVADGRLLELAADGSSAACLASLDAAPSGQVQWSPAGDQVLLGGDVVIDAVGPRATGYVAENNGVRWSFPTGKALIAPSVGDGTLVWRSSRDQNNRLDVSFLADTDVVVYHPAGKDILAVGTAADGVAGLFIASNRGENARPIATLDDPTTRITEVVPDTSGAMVYFVHDHGDMWEVHGLGLPDLGLFDLHHSDEPLGDLLRSPFGSRTLVRQGDCAGPTAIVDIGTGGTPVLLSGPNANVRLLDPSLDASSVRPLGFLDEDRLVVTVRDAGCDGPADVWVVNMSPNPSPDGLAGLTAVQVLESVESVAVRSVLTNWGEIPGDITNRAPG